MLRYDFSMKRLLLPVTALLFLSTIADAANFAEVYVGGGGAYEMYDGTDNGAAALVNAGAYLYKSRRIKAAFEGEASYTVLPPELSALGVSVDLKTTTFALYATGEFYLNSRFYIKPRAGAIYRSYAISGSVPSGYSVTVKDDEIGAAFGLGAGVKINPSLDIYADYTMVDGTDVTHATLGLQYHFMLRPLF